MVEPPDFTRYFLCHLRNSLPPVTPDNARILRMTAAAGTELADPYSYRTFNRAARARRYPGTKAVYNP